MVAVQDGTPSSAAAYQETKPSKEDNIVSEKNATSKPHHAEDLHVVHGDYYDLSEFQHPGGLLILSQSRGTDITQSAESHHFSEQWSQLLSKARTAGKEGHQGVVHVARSAVQGEICDGGYSFKPEGFFHTVKAKIAKQLLADHGTLRPRPSSLYTLKVFTMIAVYLFSWYRCCFCSFRTESITARIISMLPLVGAMLSRPSLVGIGHEAVHGRSPNLGAWFSKIVDPSTPYIGGLTGNFLWHLFDAMLGFPSEKWHYEHCLMHHPHTKRFPELGSDGKHSHGEAKEIFDPDETLAFLRMNERVGWKPFPHRIQVFLQVIVSSLFSFITFIEHQLIPRSNTLLSSSVFILLFQFLPIFTHPDGKLVGLKVMAFVIMISNIITLHAFHVSHINEHTSEKYYIYDEKNPTDWGEHQVRTSCNWVPGSISLAAFGLPWISYSYGITGMLEMQIEHHLFPALPYEVQQEIVHIVKGTAKDFGIKYTEFSGMLPGLQSHLSFMHELGKVDQPSKSEKKEM
jgi:fatty acid desaturase